MDEKFLPWEEDELVFLPGDWEIERADTAGLYNYTICGIRGSRSVDGVQLIEWNMAQLLRYSMLTPWNNSGIEFNGTTDVARDVLDFGDNEAERKYLVFVGKKLMRANKYYLVKNGMAVASDALKRKVSQQIVRSNKYNKACKPWVSDDILILAPPTGETIERGASEGVYKLRRKGMTVTYSAARLVEEKYALNGYDVKLEDMCESEKITLANYKDGTHEFWLCDYPNSVKTLRDIAKLWNDLEMGYDGTLATKIMSHNRNIFVACSQKEMAFNGYNATFAELDREYGEYYGKVDGLQQYRNELEEYQYLRINHYFGSYSDLKNKVTVDRNSAVETGQNIIRKVNTLKSELDREYGDNDEAGVFPINILPLSLQEIMREEYEKIQSFKTTFDGKRDEIKKRADEYIKKVNLFHDDVLAIDALVDAADKAVEKIVQRRNDLDRAKASIDARLLNKKPLIAKKDKNNGIKFTTKVKVTIDGNGKFTVYDTFGRGPTVTAEELIYMGLAEYYY